jgi:predicted lipoprotein with Yx(FWY)xxD motif
VRRSSVLSGALAAGVLVLAGCGSDDAADPVGATASPAEASPSAAGPAADALLATADTDLGTVVVDGEGMTVYVFDRDTPGSGTSSCSGECLVAWPPVVAESESPTVDGVTGEIGTITRDAGTLQVTLEGWPLHYWQDDAAPGDTTGQAANDVWWVVSPDDTKITSTTAPAALPAY